MFQERPEPLICTTASDGRSDGDVESEAVQLKLLRQQMYSKKMLRSLKILKTCKVSSLTKGHMKSSLDGRPSTFSDSSFGTVCLFLYVFVC